VKQKCQCKDENLLLLPLLEISQAKHPFRTSSPSLFCCEGKIIYIQLEKSNEFGFRKKRITQQIEMEIHNGCHISIRSINI
jgi:hypothetical protein